MGEVVGDEQKAVENEPENGREDKIAKAVSDENSEDEGDSIIDEASMYQEHSSDVERSEYSISIEAG